MSLRTFLRGLSRPQSSSVEFIHSQKSANLGDKLCTPKHYFTFQPSPSAGRIAIIGGGAWTSFGVEVAGALKADHKVLWGVGRSLKLDRLTSEIDFAAVGRLFDQSSTRDPEWAINGVALVPCVSVFHPICDIAPGERTGLFFNASPKASGEAINDFLGTLTKENPEFVLGTNVMPEREFLQAFSATKRIITNSYHIAYWGLLSGRPVTVIGYSSKFTSLMALFDRAPTDVITYTKGDEIVLRTAVKTALDQSPRIPLTNADLYKRRFRELNERFADELVRSGLFTAIKHRQRNLG